MMNLNYPFHIANHGQVALTDRDTYIDQLIEQTLFTIPGERLNRPEFGCNIMSLVHQHPNKAQLVTAQYMVEMGLNRSIGKDVKILKVEINAKNEVLYIRIIYEHYQTKQPRTLEFRRDMAG